MNPENNPYESITYRFGPFSLDGRGFILQKQGTTLEAQPKTLEVLRYLIEHRDRVVTKDELLAQVWPGTVVSETAMTRAIMKARRALDDGQEWIQTLHGRGYRFVGQVDVVDELLQAESPSSSNDEDARLRTIRRRSFVRLLTSYGAFIWLANQGLAMLWEAFDWPRYIQQTLLIASLVGVLPVAILGWIFVLTPEGLKRPHEIVKRSLAPGRWVNTVTIGLLTIALMISISLNLSERNDPGEAAPVQRVAVLPFRNLTADPTFEYFGAGLSISLRQDLSRLPNLQVIAKASSTQLEKLGITAANRLQVSHVIEGSVQQNGDSVRVHTAVLSGQTGEQLWVERFDIRAGDLLAAQDQVALQTTLALANLVQASGSAAQSALQQAAQQASTLRGTDNLDAYQAYLKGLHHQQQRTKDSLQQAEVSLRKAVELDPTYAKAHAHHALVTLQLATFGITNRAQGYLKARQMADKAIGFDASLSLPHRVLAEIQSRYEWNFAAAAATAQLARNLAPNNTDIAVLQAGIWSKMGMADRAADEVSAIWVLDPLNPAIASSLTIRLIRAQRFEAAEQALQDLLALEPEHGDRHWLKAQLHLDRGEPQLALEAIAHDELDYLRLSVSAIAYHHLGDADASEAALQELIRTDAQGAAFQIAEVYAQRGEPQNTYEWLQRAFQARDPGFAELLSSSAFRPLYADPAFQAFVDRLRLPADTSVASDTLSI